MVHELRTIGKIVEMLENHFPQCRRTQEQFSALVADWAEDLAAYPPALLEEAAKEARRNERFFPNLAVMRAYAEAALEERGKWAQRAKRHAPKASAARCERGGLLAGLLARRFAAADEGERAAHAEAFQRLLSENPKE